MKHFNANGMTISQILGFSKPKEKENDLDKAELLYKKRLARLDQIGGGQIQVKSDLSIPAHTHTGFVPYITSVGKQCLQPMAYGIKLMTLLFFVSLLFNNAFAQSPDREAVAGVGEATPLQIGDAIPDELWNLPLQVVNHPEGKETITLSEYKDKLIILDFWATWCVPCIKSFPKIDSLNSELGEHLTILPVTVEDSEKISSWLEKQPTRFNLSYLIDRASEQRLIDYFPHRMVPHIVILDSKTVRTITTGSELNLSNLQELLDGNDDAFVLKRDSVEFDISKPLLVGDINGSANDFQFRSLFTSSLDGVGSEYTILRDKERGRVSHKVINLSFKTAWSAVYGDIVKLRNNQFIMPDDCREILDSVICYELILPMERQHLAPQKIKEDLVTFFGYVADWETRSVPTLVLEEMDENTTNSKEGGLVFSSPLKIGVIRDFSAAGLVYAINSIICNDVFAINSLDKPRSLNRPSSSERTSFHTLKELNDWLRPQSLQIVVRTNDVDYLTFRKI